MGHATRIASRSCAALGLAAGLCAAGTALAQDKAVPRLLQAPAPSLPTVRTPTLAFKGAAWPNPITTAALVHGAAGWPALKSPALVFAGRTWPVAVTTAPLVLASPPARALTTLPPAPVAAPLPSLLNRSR